ncbi:MULTISPECIES: hypothetical protein [Cyanophyceae]|uniref:hypothetical protein n=1 Tax=Cyanophyceae TaxID=3028117 RepID=UPI001686B89B|nr:hypothetical protein [Trichocoleus sp. FACHB-40]MBD2002119.1 hypothetical protein [Trichocoleus sp. FACHB-40]
MMNSDNTPVAVGQIRESNAGVTFEVLAINSKGIAICQTLSEQEKWTSSINFLNAASKFVCDADGKQ